MEAINTKNNRKYRQIIIILSLTLVIGVPLFGGANHTSADLIVYTGQSSNAINTSTYQLYPNTLTPRYTTGYTNNYQVPYGTYYSDYGSYGYARPHGQPAWGPGSANYDPYANTYSNNYYNSDGTLIRPATENYYNQGSSYPSARPHGPAAW